MPRFSDSGTEFVINEAQFTVLAALVAETKAVAASGSNDADTTLVVTLSEPTGSGLFEGCIAVEVSTSSRQGGGNVTRHAVYGKDGETVASSGRP